MKRLLSIVIASCVGLTLLFAFGKNTVDSGVAEGYKIGDIAEDFNLQNAIDDSWVSLASYGDVNGYIITFTCNHCPYSVMYEDRLIELHNTYAPQGYPVIAINPNDPVIVPEDSYDNMKIRARDKAFPFKYLFDAKQTVYPKYGATRTPHIFLLDANREVKYIGAIDNHARDASAVTEKYLANAIEALKSGEHPDPDFTRAVGCTIKFQK